MRVETGEGGDGERGRACFDLQFPLYLFVKNGVNFAHYFIFYWCSELVVSNNNNSTPLLKNWTILCRKKNTRRKIRKDFNVFSKKWQKESRSRVQGVSSRSLDLWLSSSLRTNRMEVEVPESSLGVAIFWKSILKNIDTSILRRKSFLGSVVFINNPGIQQPAAQKAAVKKWQIRQPCMFFKALVNLTQPPAKAL